jgi:hypothetical protein
VTTLTLRHDCPIYVKSNKVSNFLFYAVAGIADAAGRISTLQVRCPCGKSFENADSYLEHKRLCAIHQGADNSISMTPGSNRRAATVPVRASVPASSPEKILCPCGQRFTTEKKLENHLRYSKAHQAGKPRARFTPKGTTSVSVPIMASLSSPSSISPALGPVLGTISFPAASLIPFTCGRAFGTQQVLDLHKCDSLYQGRQADKSLIQNQEEDNSLVSSFASLNLKSVSTEAWPLVARFACVCGRTFTSQKVFAKHEQEKGRLAWREQGERREKVFKAPRQQYQVDEDLRDRAAIFARQYTSGE